MFLLGSYLGSLQGSLGIPSTLTSSLGRTLRCQATQLVAFASGYILSMTYKFQGLTPQRCQVITLRTHGSIMPFCVLSAKAGELFVYLVAPPESLLLSPCLACLTLLFYFSDCSTLLYWNILTSSCTYMRAYVRMQHDVPSHYSRLAIPPGPSCSRGHVDF